MLSKELQIARSITNDARFILVTGPQRAGTTIGAKILADISNKQFLPEGVMAVQNKEQEARILPKLLDLLRKDGESAVIQCPIQCRFIHEAVAPDVAIIMMRRPITDIVRSERRVGWGDYWQRVLYADVIKEFNFSTNMPISEVKYLYWERYQQHQVHGKCSWFNLHYSALQGHQLFITKSRRVAFRPRQVGPEEDYTYWPVYKGLE